MIGLLFAFLSEDVSVALQWECEWDSKHHSIMMQDNQGVWSKFLLEIEGFLHQIDIQYEDVLAAFRELLTLYEPPPPTPTPTLYRSVNMTRRCMH